MEIYYCDAGIISIDSRSVMTTRGFSGRRPSDEIAHRLPPGQYRTEEFPVLAKGPTPRVDPAIWRFTIHDGSRPLASWSWAEFQALPQTIWRGDIHCVTKWSKLDTTWSGVTIDDLATLCGVTTRTIRRDLQALEEAGFPIYDDKNYWDILARPIRQREFRRPLLSP